MTAQSARAWMYLLGRRRGEGDLDGAISEWEARQLRCHSAAAAGLRPCQRRSTELSVDILVRTDAWTVGDIDFDFDRFEPQFAHAALAIGLSAGLLESRALRCFRHGTTLTSMSTRAAACVRLCALCQGQAELFRCTPELSVHVRELLLQLDLGGVRRLQVRCHLCQCVLHLRPQRLRPARIQPLSTRRTFIAVDEGRCGCVGPGNRRQPECA